MRRTCSNGLKLDLTENTPGSSSTSRLPNLVEHAENCQIPNGGTGENLSSKLPNVVEGSMDYGSERRSSRYLDFDPSKSYQDAQGTGNYGEVEANYVDRGYSTRTLDRKIPYERENLERYDNRIYPEESLRYDRRGERTYQESDLDAPYERTDAAKLRNYPLEHQDTRRYSRDLNDYEYTTRYAEETLKLEPKKDHRHQGKVYEVPASKGYESGVKTRESSYELGSCATQDYTARKYDSKYDSKYDNKYHAVGQMYGTLPRYEATAGKSYDTYDTGTRNFETNPKYDPYETGVKTYDPAKYEITSSKSYERTKYESSSRYQESAKSYEQTLKIGEVGSSSSTAHPRKQNPERSEAASVKMNGCRKNNFEAYGVYSDPEDDHGFLADKKAPQYTYKGVVVNASGESTVVEQKRTKEGTQTEVQTSPWCKPTILLLLLVLLVVIFVLVAGILLYFNCEYYPAEAIFCNILFTLNRTCKFI